MKHLGNCPECGADLDANEPHAPGCLNNTVSLLIAPLALNATHRFGPKNDYLSWEKIETLLHDQQIGVVPRYDAKVYSAAIDEGLRYLKSAGFSNVGDLNKIQEVNLALFYYVGMSYYRSGNIHNAAACLSIVYSQLRFLNEILSNYKQYPINAGRTLLEIAARHHHESTAEDIEAFLKPNVGKSGCFVATAACGDPFAPQVIALSAWRDEVLLGNRIGRAFMCLYYLASPPFAALIARSGGLRRAAMVLLVGPAVRLVNATWSKNQEPST